MELSCLALQNKASSVDFSIEPVAPARPQLMECFDDFELAAQLSCLRWNQISPPCSFWPQGYWLTQAHKMVICKFLFQYFCGVFSLWVPASWQTLRPGHLHSQFPVSIKSPILTLRFYILTEAEPKPKIIIFFETFRSMVYVIHSHIQAILSYLLAWSR